MKLFRFFKISTLILAGLLLSCNNETTGNIEDLEADSLIYDAALAKKYGADDYGMKKYVFAFLYRGENRSADSARAAELQMEHMQNIRRMAEEGKLVLAGPFFGNDDLRGIYIFDVSSLEEAAELTNSDPAIQAGVLRMELKEWYGSAGLVGLAEIYPKITKQSFAE